MSVLGVDIGNAYGYVSLLSRKDDDPVSVMPASMPEGMSTAAYVHEDGSIAVNSAEQEQLMKRNPSRVVREVKTQMRKGRIELYCSDSKVPETVVKSDQVYAAIARELLALAHKNGSGKIYDIVLTFPASFETETQLLERMQRAVESMMLDGQHIRVVGRLPEPAAVAIDYLHYMQNAPEGVGSSKKQLTVLVYDLGHGTFDTALVTVSDKDMPYQLLMQDGIPELGGKNFDDRLTDEILNVLQEQHRYKPQNENECARIRLEAVKVKHQLSSQEEASAEIYLRTQDEFVEVTVTRERFEEMTGPLINETLEKTQDLLDYAEEKGIAVDYIVLSGGGSYMPMVRQSLEALTEGNIPVVLHRPSTAVSFGAARYAFSIGRSGKNEDKDKDIKDDGRHNEEIIHQYAAYNYGIRMPSNKYLEGEVQVMISQGSLLPAVSEPLVLTPASARLVVCMERTEGREFQRGRIPVQECVSVFNLPFDVPPSERCTLTMTLGENRRLSITCTLSDGRTETKWAGQLF